MALLFNLVVGIVGPIARFMHGIPLREEVEEVAQVMPRLSDARKDARADLVIGIGIV